MKNETIDILIPAYNVEKYIGGCLDSLLNQTYTDIKIIIVDDGSTDKTAKIIQNYANNHKNIEFYEKKNEKSISKTRNFLIDKIKSKYFTFFDSDDYAEPNYIEELFTNLISFDADVSLCGLIRRRETKHANLKKINNSSKIMIFNQQEAIAEMLSSNLYNGTGPAKLFKTSLIKGARFDENIHYGEDLDFCYNLMKNAKKLVLTTKKLYHYIIRKNSIVTSKFKTTKLSCIYCYDKIIEDVKDNLELLICAKSMQGLIAIELLYYTWRDKFKDKEIKHKLKKIIKESIPYIRQNKRLSKINRKAPSVWWLTKIM